MLNSYKVIDFRVGLYECNTLYIEVGNDIFQVPVEKSADADASLIGKLVTIEDLYKVPLSKIVVAVAK